MPSQARGSESAATMNPNLLLDPFLCETVEAHQRELLETARVAEPVTVVGRGPPFDPGRDGANAWLCASSRQHEASGPLASSLRLFANP